MKVIYVDDEQLSVHRFTLMTQDIAWVDSTCFIDPREALAFCETNEVQLAVLDVDLPEMDGICLAKALREKNPKIELVFITAYDGYAMQAFSLDAVGYLLKPFSRDSLLHELEKAKRMKLDVPQKVFIQTMPWFDVFVEGELLAFPGRKVKELLALLVDKKGGEVSSEYAITYLWEDRPYDKQTQALYRVLKKSLRDILKSAGIEFILQEQKGKIAIRKDVLTCDLYRLLADETFDAQAYDGRYMSSYSWAEETGMQVKNLLKVKKR